jgi:outer membrane protein OmpA-like peptidoglycan-associated protein
MGFNPLAGGPAIALAAALAIGGTAAHAHAAGRVYHHTVHRHADDAAMRSLLMTQQSVWFESDSFNLTPESQRSLALFAHRLEPEAHWVRIEAVGYADATGTDPHNLLLAERRATAVLHYLHTRGVSLLRMSAASYGEGMPSASNTTPSGRAENRRVLIVVLPFKDRPRET